MGDAKPHVFIQSLDAALVADCLDAKLNEEMTIQAWGDELTKALEQSGHCERFVINFQNVQFMSSSALRTLISLNKKAVSKKVALFLCEINPNILEVFKITKLDSFFKIRKTQLEAIVSK